MEAEEKGAIMEAGNNNAAVSSGNDFSEPNQDCRKSMENTYYEFTWREITCDGSVAIPAELHEEIRKCMRISFQYFMLVVKKNLRRLQNNLHSTCECEIGDENDDDKLEDFENPEAKCPNCCSEPFKKFKYFGAMGEMTMLKFMRRFGKFDETPLHPELDPFEGQVVFIDTSRFWVSTEKIIELVTSFLKNYGYHISTLNLTLPKNEDITKLNKWLIESLSMLPNLKHLKVNEDGGRNVFGCEKELDLEFGEIFELSPAEMKKNFREKHLKNITFEEYCEHYEAMKADKLYRFGAESEGYFSITTCPDPVPRLEQSLETLKLCGLSPINFNTLIWKYGKSVSGLHIEPSVNCIEYVNWGASLGFPNLKSFYVKLHSKAEAQKLWSLDPSWGSLTKVHLDYDWKAEFMGWEDILKIVQDKWGANLIDLKIRLPKATNEEEKRRVREDAANCALILPKLKTMKIWISDPEDVPLDFLQAVKEQLENAFEISTNKCNH